MTQSTWQLATTTYPHIAFNDQPSKRNKKTVLFAVEGYNIVPSNYDVNIVSQYGGYITTNSLMYDKFKPMFGERCWLLNGCVRWDDINPHFDQFTAYDQKKNAVCLIQRHRVNKAVGDLVQLRTQTMVNLNNHSMTADCFGKVPYNGNLYKGPIGNNPIEQSPSTISKLVTLSQYRFNLCFENVYHPTWSYDMLTEKMIDCFRAKTVPIYYGCYNIQDIIPDSMYVDFRRFANKPPQMLVDYLNSISTQQYIDMVESAHQFVNTWTEYGTVSTFTKLADTI